MAMSRENYEGIPKFACRRCGSVKLRGNFFTRQVFFAEGDGIIHVASGDPESGKLELYCFNCDEEIEGWFTEEIPIE